MRTAAEIFAAECASCHGADGSGASGPSLFDRLPKVADDEIGTLLAMGRGAMPARPLPKEELAILLPYLREKFGAYVPPMMSINGRTGAQIYADECASCHGDDGMGGSGMRRNPNLVERVPKHSDESITAIVTRGTGSMPARMVTPEEVPVLIEYLRMTFGAYAAPASGMEGAAIFDAQCARCHGADGNSGMRAPHLSERILHLSNPYLTLTITQGSGNMRGRSIPDAELLHLIAHLRATHGPYSHGSPDIAIDPNPGAPTYLGLCASCHGMNGEGTMQGSSLVERVPLLSNALLVEAITDSLVNHPTFETVLEPELTPLVAHLRARFGVYMPPMIGRRDGGMGMSPDGGGMPIDPADAGQVTEDAATPGDPADAGTPMMPTDAGTPPMPADAGTPPTSADAGTPPAPTDAGAPPMPADAGTNPDATAAPDASPVADASVDAGPMLPPITPHPTCGNGVADQLEICDGADWATWASGPSCGDFSLGTGTATCDTACYPSFASCSTQDLCASQNWYNDGWCDACEATGGVLDSDCDVVCLADGFCGEYWDTYTGRFTCQARGYVDPDCGTCGDGVAAANEFCDGLDLAGSSCSDYGYASGTLNCTASCLPDLSQCSSLLCEDTCTWANDGECDDGGPGSDWSVCTLGTDCADCGPR